MDIFEKISKKANKCLTNTEQMCYTDFANSMKGLCNARLTGKKDETYQ